MRKNNFFFLVISVIIIYTLSIYVYYQKSQENAIEKATLHVKEFLLTYKATKKFFMQEREERLKKTKNTQKQESDIFSPQIHSCIYSIKKINKFYNKIRQKEHLLPITIQFISDNPKNINHLASNAEKKVLNNFRTGAISSFTEIKRNYNGSKSLFYTTADEKLKTSCLDCHGNPKNAPKALIKEYGNTNGFYQKYESIHSFVKVSIPLDSYLKEANDLYQTRALFSFLALCSILFLIYIFANKAKTNEEKLQVLTDALSELVIIKNNTNLICVNKAFLNFFAIKDKEEFLNKYAFMNETITLDNKDISINLSQIDDNVLKKLNDLEKNERIFTLQDGQKQTKKLTISIHKLNNISGEYIIVLSDITQIQNKTSILEKKANIDSLTKAITRQKFDELFKIEFHRSQRYINSLSLIIFDIDHFKNVNDTYGHDVGDIVLKNFAAIIQNAIRESDVFARWGGEEFILMLPQTDINAAFKIGEKLRNKIAENEFEIIGNLTCSVGISMLRKEDDVKSLIKRADNALYKAKNSGRNKTIIYL